MKKEYPDILKLEGEKWQNPDPATGKLGTRVPAEWLQTTEDSLKSLTLEMLEVLKAAGINPNELNNTQVRDAIQKMILARVINYNDIQGRPIVKDSLGDDRNNPASQRVVNDVNNNANTRLEKSKNLSDLTNVSTARSNLGLKSSATLDATSTLSDRTDQVATIKAVNDVNRAASNAQTSANNANDKANTAQTTANQAKSAAATADGKATSAQSKADSAYNLASKKRDISDRKFEGEVSLTAYDVFLRCLKDGISFFSISISEGDRASLNSYPNGKYQSNRLPEKPGTLAIREELLGIGTGYFDVLHERTAGGEYTNTTDRSILVIISGKRNSNLLNSVYVNNKIVANLGADTTSTASIIVPPGSTYSVAKHNETVINAWSELR